MEAPTWHPVWTSFTWTKFKDEFRYLRYHAVATRDGVFFTASTLPISDGPGISEADIPRLSYPTPASTWPTEFLRGGRAGFLTVAASVICGLPWQQK